MGDHCNDDFISEVKYILPILQEITNLAASKRVWLVVYRDRFLVLKYSWVASSILLSLLACCCLSAQELSSFLGEIPRE